MVGDEIVNVTDKASTNMTNTLSTNETNVTNTSPMNSDDNKVRFKIDCYILHTFLLVIILSFIITIKCYHYTKHRLKQKCIGELTI